jgi:hypothetical protein
LYDIVPRWQCLLGFYGLSHPISHTPLFLTSPVIITISTALDSDPLMSCVRAVFRCPHSLKASR